MMILLQHITFFSCDLDQEILVYWLLLVEVMVEWMILRLLDLHLYLCSHSGLRRSLIHLGDKGDVS